MNVKLLPDLGDILPRAFDLHHIGGRPYIGFNPVAEVSELKRIIDLVLHPDRARAFGAAARRRMPNHFSFDAQATAYRSLFAELVADRPSRRPVPEAVCA